VTLKAFLAQDAGAALFLVASTIGAAAAGIASGQPLLLLVLSVVFPYLIFFDRVRAERHGSAFGLMVLWAFLQTVSVVLLAQAMPDEAASAIFRGTTYRDEMFRWIQTGEGREGQ
jgi:hypothetical protein